MMYINDHTPWERFVGEPSPAGPFPWTHWSRVTFARTSFELLPALGVLIYNLTDLPMIVWEGVAAHADCADELQMAHGREASNARCILFADRLLKCEAPPPRQLALKAGARHPNRDMLPARHGSSNPRSQVESRQEEEMLIAAPHGRHRRAHGARRCRRSQVARPLRCVQSATARCLLRGLRHTLIATCRH